jgi:hypothetical protein
VRTTLNLDDHLLRSAKKEAAERGVTLTSLIEDALRAALATQQGRSDYNLCLPVVKGRRPPAVDVSDRDAVYELMEGRE